MNDVTVSGLLMRDVSFAEAMVLIHFVVLALLWLTRNPEVVPGWQSFLSHK